MRFPADQFSDDWMDLHEARVLRGLVVKTSDPLECEEDWATVRGQTRWFAALFEDIQDEVDERVARRIPGTLRAFSTKPEHVAHVTSTRGAIATHVAFWALDEAPSLVKLSEPVQLGPLTASTYIYADGHVGYRWVHPNIVTATGNITLTTGTSSSSTNTASFVTFTHITY